MKGHASHNFKIIIWKKWNLELVEHWNGLCFSQQIFRSSQLCSNIFPRFWYIVTSVFCNLLQNRGFAKYLQVRKMLGFQIPNDSYLLSETVSDKKDRKFRRAARANTNKEEEKQHEQFLIFASRPKPAEGCFPHQLALKTWRAERADFFVFSSKSSKKHCFEPWPDSIDWNRNQNTAPRCSGLNI